MAGTGGFWSYVHADDAAEGGRITKLGEDIAAQYELLSGQPINLFVDQTALLWGDDWRDKVDTALVSIAFFIPVITPRYFESTECRREFQRFVARAELLGLTELILPVVYVTVPAIQETEPSDELVRVVKRYQWEDWRELRFADREEAVYRRAVARLAERLLNAETMMAAVPGESLPGTVALVGQGFPPTAAGSVAADEEAGFVDIVAAFEEALPRLTLIMTEIGELIELVGSESSVAGEEMKRRDALGKGFGGRITVIRQLAKQLEPPSQRIAELSSEFTADLYHVDQGFRVLIAAAPAEIERDPSGVDQVCGFFAMVRKLSTAATSGLTSIQGMVDSIVGVEPLSRDLRPVMRTLRTGLAALVEGQSVTDEWVRLLENSPVQCPDQPEEPPALT